MVSTFHIYFGPSSAQSMAKTVRKKGIFNSIVRQRIKCANMTMTNTVHFTKVYPTLAAYDQKVLNKCDLEICFMSNHNMFSIYLIPLFIVIYAADDRTLRALTSAANSP